MHEVRPRRAGPNRLLRTALPLLLLLAGVPLLARFYIDVRWYDELGFAELFMTPLLTRALLALGTGLFAGAVLAINLKLCARVSRGLPALYLYDQDGVPRVDLGELSARLVLPVAAAIAILTGLYHDRHWTTYLQFVHATPFGVRDPIFGRDVAFYVFSLPLYEAACSLVLFTLGASLALAGGAYALRGALVMNELGARVHPRAQKHLSVLLGLFLSALAVRAYFDLFEILHSTRGPMTGASYADVTAKLPMLRIKIGVTAVAALLAFATATRRDFNLTLVAAALYVLSAVGVRAYPSVVQQFSVLPNEVERETPYLKHNIDATRAAYGLDRVQERDLTGRGTLSAEDIAQNSDTIDNIRLWDHGPLLETFAQIQEIRTYYDFAAVDNDRYVIDGKLRQVMLSARELKSDANSLPNPTWINRRLKYTHGYGLTLGPVNEATPEGMPVLFVQDIPPVSSTPDIRITQPAIYFGELSSDYVFVRTRNREFHYPSGQGSVEHDYDGRGGIRIDSPLLRPALALELGSFEILLSDDIDSNSRALLHRNIRTRVQRLVPFLRLDPDPYLVVREDGTLAWIYDAYTVTDRYPYSEPHRASNLNYVRNSVKIVIDAYHGSVTLYVADPRDPLLRTYRRIFPNSFTPMEEMPKDLRAHLRYPESIFRVQTDMFTVYHMRDPEVLYHSEDLWEVPGITSGSGKDTMQPYYTVMKLPGERSAEFILMLPFTPKRKDNLAAWMVARSDGERLSELVVYRFPKDRVVFGPQQVVSRINQDAEIARQISLWSQRGSQAVFGTLLVIPIEESLIYVRPLYLRSEGGKIPELKRVIVAYEKQIAMRPSLREALEAIFGGAPADSSPVLAAAVPDSGAVVHAAQEALDPGTAQQPAAPGSAQTTAPDAKLAGRALQHFERAVSAQRGGDWVTYGAELRAVEDLLRQMAPLEKAPSSGPVLTPH
jgi:uncharacterized protein